MMLAFSVFADDGLRKPEERGTRNTAKTVPVSQLAFTSVPMAPFPKLCAYA